MDVAKKKDDKITPPSGDDTLAPPPKDNPNTEAHHYALEVSFINREIAKGAIITKFIKDETRTDS